MRTVALIAVKSRVFAKSRLAAVLDEPRRVELVYGMLERVVAAAHGAPGVDQVTIVSPEGGGLPPECSVLLDEGRGLNVALTAATAALLATGSSEVLILPADLPGVGPEDVEALLVAGREAGAAIAPDQRNTGTNALYLRLPVPIAFRFGAESCARHASALRAAGIEPALLRRPGLAFDLDEPQDLACIGGLLRSRTSQSPPRTGV